MPLQSAIEPSQIIQQKPISPKSKTDLSGFTKNFCLTADAFVATGKVRLYEVNDQY